MNPRLALRLLGEVMQWSDEQAHEEYAWLRLMARMKYDAYGDYLAGMRFVESLCNWLQQFSQSDRSPAYDFVKARLVFISHAEINRLVSLFYTCTMRPHLAQAAADQCCIAAYLVWSNKVAVEEFQRLRRQTLIMGLSDGARLDLLRRSHPGVISNEQVVTGLQIGIDKWEDLGKELTKDVGKDARFSRIYVVDDFVASGRTLIRKDPDTGKWKGKLRRLYDGLASARASLKDQFPVEESASIHVHHHLATEEARNRIETRNSEARKELGDDWFDSVTFTEGMVLPASIQLDQSGDSDFLRLADLYYDSAIEDRHTKVGGTDDMKRGFAGCALPVVLEHNTPNNSMSLLWAETSGENGAHAMRPLFRRRSRHTDVSGEEVAS